MTPLKEKGWRGLKICHVVTDSIVFGHYSCMVPNIKTYFDKK